MKSVSPLQTLLQKPMTRQEFLTHIGVASLFLLGGGFIMRSLMELWRPGVAGTQSAQSTSFAYGLRSYGGK
ncbi:MAG: hypothetical protein Q4B05_00240 [Candidatus Saccharibacteria bacterium]|nr:hypothetical protein [Candidatus Saccharibacteria bacterium]